MSQAREVLVVGVGSEEFGATAAVLERREFLVRHFASGDHAIELFAKTRFALVFVRYPLAGFDVYELLEAVRARNSLCRDTPLLLLAASAEDVEEAGLYVGRGANRVVRQDDESLLPIVSELLDVAPRRQARWNVRLESELDGELRETVLCESENISRTGVLVRTDRRYPLGTELHLELSLVGEDAPVKCVAEVVRHTVPGREPTGGLGMRFVRVEAGGRERLHRWLDAQGPAA